MGKPPNIDIWPIITVQIFGKIWVFQYKVDICIEFPISDWRCTFFGEAVLIWKDITVHGNRLLGSVICHLT